MAQASRPSQEEQSTRDFSTTKLSARIRTARQDRGWTQREVAHKAGITVRSVSGWERGKAIPHLGKLEALARALGQEPQPFTTSAQLMAAERRAVRVGPAAARIANGLREVEQRLRIQS
jgi:transcriptional regulator with XRE-family HTH domain